MSGLETELDEILAQGPVRILLTSPRHAEPRRAEFECRENRWRQALQRGTQVFHSWHGEAELPDVLADLLRKEFGQLHAFTAGAEFRLRLTKKGKVLKSKSALREISSLPGEFSVSRYEGHRQAAGHDRQKRALLPEGEVIAPLVDMGVFTPDGRVAKRMHAKYRQVNRFVEIVDDVLKKEDGRELQILDFGCGKSYLTFVLYHYLARQRGFSVRMTGLDLKEDVVAHCNAAAQKYGYDGLHFLCGDIAEYQNDGPLDMVLCLHACDTATDAALANAARWGAKYIFAVPCCQHELNGQIQSEGFALLTRYGIIKERTAALMTDAVRANLLVACGYKTQVLEFVDFEDTPKNLLLRAVKTGQPDTVKAQAFAEVERLCEAFSLRPTLLEALRETGVLPPEDSLK